MWVYRILLLRLVTSGATKAGDKMLNLNTPEALESFVQDPYPALSFLRAQGIVKSPNGEWLIARDADVDLVLRDARFGKQPPPGTEHRLPFYARDYTERSSMLDIDPPNHTRIRSRFAKAFSAKRIEGMRSGILELVDSLLDTIIPSGRMEAMQDFARPIPSTIIADMLGVPAADRPRFNDISMGLIEGLGVDPATTLKERNARSEVLREAFSDYLSKLFAAKRAAPEDDLISALLHRNEVEEALTESELITNILLLFVAGHETTVNLIGNSLVALARHPDQLRKLRDAPALMPKAVDEFLRYDSSVQQLPRVAQADVELGGHTILAGEMVILLLASANRDEAAYKDPDVLDVERRIKRVKSFGGGAHYCLGAQLARIETEVALGRLIERIGDFSIENLHSLNYPFNLFFRGPQRLDMAWPV